MKRVIALITTAFLMFTCGIFSYSYGNASAIDKSDSEVPKIEFCQVQFILDYEKYYGIFLDSNRDVYSFAIDNVTENWNLYGAYSDIPIKLTDPMPHDGLLTYLYDHFDEWKVIGKASENDYADYKNELNQIDLNTEMAYILYAEPDVVGLSHTETFAVRDDDNGDRQIVFLSGGLSIKYDHYLENPDEHAIALNSKMIKYEEISDPVTTTDVITDQTTTAPVTPDETTTTTVTTTIAAETNTEQTTDPPTEVPKIEFCQVQFILDYEKYYGIFLDSNRDVYSFAIDNVTENWNLYGAYSDIPIKLTDPMPHDGLLTYLYDHFDEWKVIGKTSKDDYADYKNELNQIDLNTEMAYILYAEPDVVGLSHTETFAVRDDDNDDRQIVFLSGGLSIKYDHYLENPDEHAIALNSKMIKYEEISDSVTTPDEITDQTTTTPTIPDATTVTTTVTTETDIEQTTVPTTDAGGSVTTETSTVPPTTTTGTEATLPQTGYSKWYQALIAAAIGMLGVGSTAIVKSGIFRKKEINT